MKNILQIALFLLLSGTLLFSCCSKAEDSQLFSPSGNIGFTIEENQGTLLYSINYNDEPLILPSEISFYFEGQDPIKKNLTIHTVEKSSYSGSWEMPWGEKRLVNESYNCMVVSIHETTGLKRIFNIHVKAFDDGVGLRYAFPAQPAIQEVLLTEEETNFIFAGDYTAFWIPGDWDIYEHLYSKTKVSEIDATVYRGANLAQTSIPHNAVSTPVTLITEKGTHLSIHEADLTDYAEMTLKLNDSKNGFVSCLVGSDNQSWKVKRSLPFDTPWRTFQIAETAGGLIESDLIINLNDPAVTEETEWILPMKYVGIWWDMHLNRRTWDYASGNHGATTEYAKRLIDFASAHGIGGLLVEGWNTGWEYWTGFEDREGVFDFVTPYPDYDLQEVVRYGNTKGVALIMHHETSAATATYSAQLDTAFRLMKQLGIHAVKTGYVGKILPKGEYHHGQYMVNHYHQVVMTGLNYQVGINAHEPIKATGKRRTYPNILSREGLRGQEFNAWSEDGGNPPSHLPTVAFTRMLAGPIDYTPGIFNLKLSPYRIGNQVNTTIAQQLALYVVLYSPLQMVADLIDNYTDHPAFQFIKDVAVDWEQTRVLNGEVGEYVTIARQERNSSNWFIGGITNETPRDMVLKMDFLPEGKKYYATLYCDGPEAHWDNNPGDYQIETTDITSTSIITVHLAAGGGFAISLKAK